MLMTNRSIGYDAPGEDVTHGPQLDGISAALGQEEDVVEAQALTLTRIPPRCNFVSRTASPPGARALVPYAELLGITLLWKTERGYMLENQGAFVSPDEMLLCTARGGSCERHLKKAPSAGL